MELQALLVLCGVGVAGVAVLLLMGLFSTSGTSYEEAIAQQRKATSELLALADSKNKSKKTNKKANKKLAKKEKNKENTAVAGSEIDSEAPAESGVEDDTIPAKPHVEFSPPVVVELAADEPPPLIKIRKRGKDPKVKPILINKEDPSCVSDPSSASTISNVSNHFEEMQPKDEFELMQSSLGGEKVPEKKEEMVEKKEKMAKQGKAKAAPKSSSAEAPKEEAQRDRSTEAPMEQRKAKKVEKKNIVEATVVEEVVPPLNPPQPSELTTDKLLKQAFAAPAPPAASPSINKSKKKKPEQNVLALIAGDSGGVAVSELVRVVREASLSRTDIQILTDALLDKHHDPLPEHSDWSEGPNDPMQKLKKQLAEKEKALADEVEASQALHAKLKELRASLNAERGRAAAVTRASEQASAGARAELHTLQARIQRLLEDNRALAQDKLVLQTKLNEEGEAQAQRVQMEMHIQRLSEAEASLVEQLMALQAELAARAVEAGQARCEAAAARDSLLLAQQHAAELAQQLQEANRACSELEQQRQCAAHADQLAQQELRATQARIAELQNEVQRLTSRAQTAESAVENLKDDQEKQKVELTKELTSLREQLSAAESELAELRVLKAMPAQNGLPLASDDFKTAELSKVESVVEALREELAAAQRSSSEQQSQLAQLREQLAHHQSKNDELRTKNWKIMEALQTTERALQSRAAPASPARDTLNQAITKAQESQLSEVVNILSAACPHASPACPPGNDWLHTFADNLKKELQKREAEKKQIETELSAKLAETESQKKKLEIDLNNKLHDSKNAATSQKELEELTKRQVESEIQKIIREKEIEKKQFEREMQKKLQEKEQERKKLETELKMKIQESEVASEKMLSVNASEDTNSRAKDLQSQNEHLQGLVDKYKRVIDDTEGVLSRLQQNVTREEQRWERLLADKQRELEVLQQTTVQQEPLAFAYSCMEKSLTTIVEELQKKIDTLQTELQQAQKQNHSNSFADAERIAQEKLMSVGQFNGPLSVTNK